MTNNMRTPAKILTLSAGLLAVSHSGHATLIRASTTTDLVTNATSSSTTIDGGAGDTSGAIDGIITLGNGVEPLPGMVINGSDQRAQGTPVSPGPTNLLTSGSSSSINGSIDPMRRIGTISATDFTPQASMILATASGTFVNALGASITLKWWEDSSNRQGGTNALDTPGILISTYTFTTTSSDESFSFNPDPVAINAPDPFSMTLQFDYTLPAGGSLISRGQAETAPIENMAEPATLALLGIGLLSIAALHGGRRGPTSRS